MTYTTHDMEFSIQASEDKLSISWNGESIIEHTKSNPFLYIGFGKETVNMYRGNFEIKDYVEERTPLRFIRINELEDNKLVAAFSTYNENSLPILYMTIRKDSGRLVIELENKDTTINRFWIRIKASKEEKIYGCGEQMSYFNLRGRNFPLWTSEPGVGRDKSTYVTWLADVKDKAGGDYYNTNYPQPTYVSSKKYYAHVEATAYADFNFKNEDYHELHTWEVPKEIVLEGARDYLQLVEKISAKFGRQPELPDWVYEGVILGVQGGTEVVDQKLIKALESGVKVSALWCQDWQGKRITSFGKRLMWNWKWNPDEYPDLDVKIKEWKEKGIRFMGYINPYLAVEGDLFKEAENNGYFALNEEGNTYLVDFGEFYCGVIDFTNSEAFEWYKGVIKEHLIEFGLDGWMADFGEYLPTDLYLSNGEPAMQKHNQWPVLWAQANYEAVKETGKLGEVVFFMRAGYAGFQKYCTLLWGGDQSVDFSLHDGLASVIPAALSSGMSGMGLHHSDIGGYTSLHGTKRNKELLLRWLDMGVFTPFLRTHEGNRPYDCVQFDEDEETLAHFARMTTVFTHLAPYAKTLVAENAKSGTPVQRPLFLHYEQDPNVYDIQYQYLYGKDVLVAPVHEEHQNTWEVYLPKDEWIHLWSGEEYSGGTYIVNAPIGEPPVFFRKNSEWKELFHQVRSL
ncbi:alpha-glucosidase [Metabacillus litoralis]|uniref:Alpha-glucosidase n=1 Tax=Metabacillus litoralis TaxID=152268 RepID=A0A5C6VAF6_9BACI|nr:alpha-glucosidase [Metabacillus litoralis]TXC82199.1 alpha-glucosidase [Metabacillus litoralis]